MHSRSGMASVWRITKAILKLPAMGHSPCHSIMLKMLVMITARPALTFGASTKVPITPHTGDQHSPAMPVDPFASHCRSHNAHFPGLFWHWFDLFLFTGHDTEPEWKFAPCHLVSGAQGAVQLDEWSGIYLSPGCPVLQHWTCSGKQGDLWLAWTTPSATCHGCVPVCGQGQSIPYPPAAENASL